MVGLRPLRRAWTPAFAHCSRDAPDIPQPLSGSLIDPVASRTISTASGIELPPLADAVASAWMVNELIPTTSRNHILTTAFSLTCIPLSPDTVLAQVGTVTLERHFTDG